MIQVEESTRSTPVAPLRAAIDEGSRSADTLPVALACPRCRRAVKSVFQRFECVACGEVATMDRDVVDFVRTEDYASSFGRQWSTFRHVQLDSRNGTTISADQFARVTGWGHAELDGATVLDGGCGAGRYSEVAARLGAKVVGLDLSSAAFVTRENVPNCAAVVRGSILEPPFAPGSFDKVFSIGVLQHTPDPLGAAQKLMELVKPGGQLAIWMYERKVTTPFLPKMVLRRLTRGWSEEKIDRLVDRLVTAFTPVARAGAHLPGKRLKHLLWGALPIASYWYLLPLDPQSQQQWSVLDTHDWLTPKYDDPQTFEALSAALKAGGATRVERIDVPGLTVRAVAGHRRDIS